MLPITEYSTGHVFYLGIQNDITQDKGLEYNNQSLKLVENGEILHIVNNFLAIIVGTFEVRLNKSNSP